MLGLVRAGLLGEPPEFAGRSQLRTHENASPGMQASQTSVERGDGKSTSKFESPGANHHSLNHYQQRNSL